jgi:hypothetical protein
MLVLLFLANICMLLGMTNWPQRTREGFVSELLKKKEGETMEGMENYNKGGPLKWGSGSTHQAAAYNAGSDTTSNNEYFKNRGDTMTWKNDTHLQRYGSNDVGEEGFSDMLVPQASGSQFGTAPIGSYDGLNVAASLPAVSQGWRARTPNESLAGPNVDAVGPDNLFIFKNNQCKPECCGSTLSCDGGCVCTTPAQRNLINTRGGNRTQDDGF